MKKVYYIAFYVLLLSFPGICRADFEADRFFDCAGMQVPLRIIFKTSYGQLIHDVSTEEKSILNNMPSGGLGMTAQNLSRAVESGVLSGMSRALTNASIINHTDVYQRKDVLSDRVYVGSPVFTDDSVNVSGGRTLEQDVRTDYILQQILETSQKILAKDTSVKLDGKRTDTLLSRAKHNSGYSFVTT